MRVVLSQAARDQLNRQIDFIREQGEPAAARRLYDRVIDFFEVTLSTIPYFAPTLSENSDLRETVIPGTRFVVHYRYTPPDLIVVAALYYGGQLRPTK